MHKRLSALSLAVVILLLCAFPSLPAQASEKSVWTNVEEFEAYASAYWVRPVIPSIQPVTKGSGREFGASRGGRNHAAIDYLLPVSVGSGYGTPIHAVSDGVVIDYKQNFYGGTDALDVQNVDGSVIRYGEIRSSLREGDKVTQGQVVATMISNYYSNLCMLHLELYLGTATDGLSYNPSSTYDYVSGNYYRRRDIIDPSFLLSIDRTCEEHDHDWDDTGYCSICEHFKAPLDPNASVDIGIYSLKKNTSPALRAYPYEVCSYSSAETEDTLLTIPSGSRVDVTGACVNALGEQWVRVTFDEVTGYIPADSLNILVEAHPTPSPTPSATPKPSSSPSLDASAEPTPDPEDPENPNNQTGWAQVTATPVVTPKPTATPSPTPTTTPKPTATPSATATPSPTPSATATPSPTPSPSATPIATPIPTPTPPATATPIATPIATPLESEVPYDPFESETSAIDPDQSNVINPFVDVHEDDYFYIPVLWAVRSHITTGTTETTFSPEDTCTVAQMITFLWRATGSQTIKDANLPFTDVSRSDYYYQALCWADAQQPSILGWVEGNLFKPDTPCTRASSVTYIWRAQGQHVPDGDINPFTDLPDIGSGYVDAILWAQQNGITTGTTDDTFSPDLIVTRAQVMTFLYRSIAYD